MCEPGLRLPGDVHDFFTLTEGGEEFDALVDRICAEADAKDGAKAGAEADVNEHGLHGLPESELTPLSTPTGAGHDPTDNAPSPAPRVPPRLAILIEHALVTRAPKPIAKCVRGLRFG